MNDSRQFSVYPKIFRDYGGGVSRKRAVHSRLFNYNLSVVSKIMQTIETETWVCMQHIYIHLDYGDQAVDVTNLALRIWNSIRL